MVLVELFVLEPNSHLGVFFIGVILEWTRTCVNQEPSFSNGAWTRKVCDKWLFQLVKDLKERGLFQIEQRVKVR